MGKSVKELRLTNMQQKNLLEVWDTGKCSSRRVRMNLQNKGFIRWSSWETTWVLTPEGIKASGLVQREVPLSAAGQVAEVKEGEVSEECLKK